MGNALVTAPARSAFGTRRLDIRDFGAVPGDAVATRVAIQAAIESCNPANPGNGSPYARYVIFIPSGEWSVDRPLKVDYPGIEFVGEGPGSVLSGNNLHSVLVFGVRANNGGTALTGANFVDLYGKLDASAAPAAGQRWGFALGDSSHLTFPASAFTQGHNPGSIGPGGDYYRYAPALTIEWAMDLGAGPLPSGPLLGMSDGPDAFPFLIGVGLFGAGTSNVQVVFNTADGSRNGVGRRFSFSIAGLSGVCRFCVAIDPIGATIPGGVAAYVNRVQVAVATDALGPGFPAAGLGFQANRGQPFMAGAAGMQALASSGDYYFTWAGPGHGRTYLGLRVSTGIRYAPGPVGSAQARTDAAAITDLNSYFASDPMTLAYLPMTDAPSQVIGDRMVSYVGCNAGRAGVGEGFYLDAGESLWNWIQHHAVRRMSIRAADYCGYAVALGGLLNFTLEDADLSGGAYALADIPFGANYVINIQGVCGVGSFDTALSFYGAVVHQTGTLLTGTFDRLVLRLDQSGADMEYIFVGGLGGTTEAVIDVGNELRLGHLSVDFEGGGPTFEPTLKALVTLRPQSGTSPLDCVLDIRRLDIGGMPPQAVAVDVLAGQDGVQAGSVSLGTITAYGDNFAAVLRTADTRTQGAIRATQDLATPWVVNTGAGGLGGLVVDHHQFNGLPRRSSWALHAHRVVQDRPADAQFAEFRCVAAGTYGTATPPGWYGLGPIDATGAGLATYVLGHAFWTGGVATPHAGFYTDYAAIAFLNRYLARASLTPPAAVYAGLSCALEGARRDGAATEPATSNGYARVATSWTASSGGVASNAAAVTFGTPTGAGYVDGGNNPIGPATALVLFDAPAGGNAIAQVPIGSAATTAGASLSFAAGALRVAPAAVPGAGLAATALYDALNNLWLRATPPTVPAGLFFALSTSRASSSAPSEPSGGGYARASAGAWSSATTSPTGGLTFGWSANATTVAFPAPSGSWGTSQSIYLMDAATGGNVVASGNLTVPRPLGPGSPAPTVAAGAFWVSWS